MRASQHLLRFTYKISQKWASSRKLLILGVTDELHLFENISVEITVFPAGRSVLPSVLIVGYTTP